MVPPKTLLCRTAALSQVSLAKTGDVILSVQTPDEVWHHYAFSPSQIRGITGDFAKALNFHTEAGCPDAKRP